ncbi:MAG: hypothetical protein R3284_08280, partial [Rubricoccaceae bacterium]|nr:hypothetical protein [Rubricoccaceae bacterium]
MHIRYIQRVRELAARLPFELEDTDAANNAYVEWRETGSPDSKRVIDLWTYCHAQLYVLKRLIRDSSVSPSDLDALVESVYARLLKGMASVRNPRRFTHWVNVVCRNTYLNGRRSTRTHEVIKEEILPSKEVPAFS